MIFPKTKVPVLQNRVFNSKMEAVNSDFGFIEIAPNKETGIIENVLFDPKKMIYDKNYDNEQSNSNVFENHLTGVCKIIEPYIVHKKVIEVGCGKGHFFRKLAALGHDVFGCDPTYTGEDPRIVKEFFTSDLNLKGDFIVLRHVLEHIQDPVSFIKSIADSNDNRGLIYIEVPDYNWIAANDVYFDIFYEHVNYFRPVDFAKIFGKIVSAGTFFKGQYQYVIADLSSINNPPYEFTPYNRQISMEKLDQTLHAVKGGTRPVYIWGAASKGVISNLHLAAKGLKIEALIDINPNKQNKFAALTGTKIISPATFKENGNHSFVLIANPNYETEIKEELKGMEITYYNL
jgi:2-polyprenyl-3-methyl-5-hydroxy-6-metoxy-1,4-benzoquinol methylase